MLRILALLLLAASLNEAIALPLEIIVEARHSSDMDKTIKYKLLILDNKWQEKKISMDSFRDWKSSGWNECIIKGQSTDHLDYGSLICTDKEKKYSVATNCSNSKSRGVVFDSEESKSSLLLHNIIDKSLFSFKLICQ